jgi:hypothetical protein
MYVVPDGWNVAHVKYVRSARLGSLLSKEFGGEEDRVVTRGPRGFEFTSEP